METGPNEVAAYLHHFLDWSGSESRPSIHEIKNGNFPVWVTQIARIHEASLGKQPLILIEPKEAITVDQGARLHKVISQTLKRPALLIADRLPMKGRGTLVRLRVPHVIANHAVYAPELGLQYRELPKLPKTPMILRPQLPTLAVTLAAYYLIHSKTLENNWTLSEWHKHLGEGLHKFSLSSLSRAFTELMQTGLIDSITISGSKKIHFIETDQVWKKLSDCSPQLISKRAKVMEKPSGDISRYLFLLSGEAALSRMSDLNEPKNETIAMCKLDWGAWQKEVKPALDESTAITVEVWEGSSIFFPKNLEHPTCINPILLALSLRYETDPRVQIAVREMLAPLELDPNILWSQK